MFPGAGFDDKRGADGRSLNDGLRGQRGAISTPGDLGSRLSTHICDEPDHSSGVDHDTLLQRGVQIHLRQNCDGNDRVRRLGVKSP